MKNKDLLLGLTALALAGGCSSHETDSATSMRAASVPASPSGEPTQVPPFASARLTNGGGLCDKENGCKYTVEVAEGELRFTNMQSMVEEVLLDGADLADVAQYVETVEFRDAVASYNPFDWANVPGATSELEVAWEGQASVVMSPIGRCISCAESEQHPLQVLSQKLWDLKLKYTGDSR